ncbi:flavodoxin family protein [Photobacterium sanctipauli]|uniref:Flavodoxin family protein n=1 Tax=Photobacterium sanctipauli TaxID=1342794 RepID=A0A2T3NP04_9GAMM|nr:NAD(P)H-dependent oxidoreductase [Photobacterium sanctipauli]PSW17645.1 flavodoxin family protein [Photobacterium sanctipauli]
MSKVVIISGHPNLEESFTNTVILNEMEAGLEDVAIRRLDTLYPNYQIDIEAEQQALLEADVIVLQFPFYWYSVPALMKKWIDDVFSYNFAFGSKGDKLKGKDFILSFTIGGPEESYDPLGYNHFSIEELMRPLQQTAYLAGMNYHKPVYTHRMVYIPNVYNELDEVQGRAKDHADRLTAQIESITHSAQGRINKFVAEWFAKFDVLPEESDYFTQYLAKDIRLAMPEGEFHGHEGFRDWYSMARGVFKPACEHLVEQVEVKSSSTDTYQVELRIRLKAETYAESALKGEPVDMLVNETWQVSFDEQGKVVIHDYSVVPVLG